MPALMMWVWQPVVADRPRPRPAAHANCHRRVIVMVPPGQVLAAHASAIRMDGVFGIIGMACRGVDPNRRTGRATGRIFSRRLLTRECGQSSMGPATGVGLGVPRTDG